MLSRFAVIIALLTPLLPAHAEQSPCRFAAREIEKSLMRFEARPDRKPYERISIRNAAAAHPAAGLDYGAKLDEATLASFPLGGDDRALFGDALRFIHRAGGPKGLVMLDAVAGTAYCHYPFIFSMASGAPKAVKAPDPGDPFELCLYGGVALGEIEGIPFYAQVSDNFIETDTLRIFPFSSNGFAASCTIGAHYALVHEVAASFCEKPGLCLSHASKAARWASLYRGTESRINDPLLSPAEGKPPEDDSLLPMFGEKENKLVPEPFRFDGGEGWFALNGDQDADRVRIGAASRGPVSMANWDAFTLVTLYKGGNPVASFVVEERRGAFKSVTVEEGR